MDLRRVKQLVKDHKDLVEFLSVPEYCATPGHCSQTADLVRESGTLNLVSLFSSSSFAFLSLY